MRKGNNLLAGLLFLLALPVLAQEPFFPIYWIKGSVADAPGFSVNGLKIYFENSKAWDIIGPAGASGKPNQFLINAGEAGVPIETRRRYKIFTELTKGFGVGPVGIELSGMGLDEIKPLSLSAGGGAAKAETMSVKAAAEPPEINLWFGNRLYQKALIEKGEKFVISSKPEIKIAIKAGAHAAAQSAGLTDYSVIVDEGSSASKTLNLSAGNVSKTFAAGIAGQGSKVNALNIGYTFDEPLSEGKHQFKVMAAVGSAASAFIATVEVIGGPLRLISPPLAFPNPFSITRNKTLTIQYGLSAEGNIEIYLIGVDGARIKRFSLSAGSEGGLAGINKITWDGRTDVGNLAGNSIYVGTVVARDEGRLLGKFKLAIVD